MFITGGGDFVTLGIKNVENEINVLNLKYSSEAVRHEREISNAGRLKLDFAERDKCKPVLLRLLLARNKKKHWCPFMGPKEGRREHG
jgi:hypothetical protein